MLEGLRGRLCPYSDKVYRGIRVKFIHHPLSGEGARLRGGRYNPKSTCALYLAEHKETVFAETQAQYFTAIPTPSIISYQLKTDALLDLSDDATLEVLQLEKSELNMEWDTDLSKLFDIHRDPATYLDFLPTLPLTQRVYFTARAAGADAIRVPSVEHEGHFNVVLYDWNTGSNTSLEFLDPEGDLTALLEPWDNEVTPLQKVLDLREFYGLLK